MTDYDIFREIKGYNLDRYMPYRGWIGNKPIKIYTSQDFKYLFLHDENAEMLFELLTVDPDSLKAGNGYELLVKAYLGFLQRKL